MPATVEATITERTSANVELNYRIDIDKSFAPKDVGFYAVVTGSAIYSEVYPGGGTRIEKNGCPAGSLFVIPDTEIHCFASQVAPDSVFSAPETRLPARILNGRITRRDANMFIQLTSYTGNQVSSQEGKRKYFRLPAIGTTYVPADARSAIDFDFDVGTSIAKTYVPGRLDVTIDYGKLAVTDRVESISPYLVLADTLAWHDNDASTVRATGTVVDVATEDADQNSLFLVGLFVGVAASLVPTLISTMVRLIRQVRNAG